MNTIQFPTNTDEPASYYLLSKSQQNKLHDWIKKNLIPYEIKTYNKHHTSTQIKHAIPFYVTNGEFKGAMLEAGFTPKEISKRNSIYKVSKKRCDYLIKRKDLYRELERW